MIDTDKYEGRSKRTAWRTSWGEPYDELNWLKENDECNEVDVQVLADAPLLLAEVKRLREGIEQAVKLLNTDANATRELLKEMIE
jgi:hypothetical protein